MQTSVQTKSTIWHFKFHIVYILVNVKNINIYYQYFC